MKQILVTGANGQMGRELRVLAGGHADARWIFADRKQLDLEQLPDIAAFFARERIDCCINCAAYTAVDRAESEPERAALVNHYAVEALAEACYSQGAAFIHFSSDYVYHNTLNRPLREDDPTTPSGTYARTKLAGDMAAQRVHPQSLIFRTSWVYSSFGQNFVQTMLRLGKERSTLRVVNDQIGSPTYARDLAGLVFHLISDSSGKSLPQGIFNYSNEGVCSWYDFAAAIFEIAGIPCKVEPIPSVDYPTPAPRPSYSVLDKSRFKSVFGTSIPYWRDSLKDCLYEIME